MRYNCDDYNSDCDDDDGDIGSDDDPEENPEVGNIQLEEERQGFEVEMSLRRPKSIFLPIWSRPIWAC